MRPLTKITFFGVRLAIVVLAVYWTFIFIGTHLPAVHDFSPQVNDKIKHFTAFFGLATLICYCTGSYDPAGASRSLVRFTTILCVCAGYAAIDEITQGFVRGRTPDWYDFAADLIGASVAVAAYILAKAVIGRTTLLNRLTRWSVRSSPTEA